MRRKVVFESLGFPFLPCMLWFCSFLQKSRSDETQTSSTVIEPIQAVSVAPARPHNEAWLGMMARRPGEKRSRFLGDNRIKPANRLWFTPISDWITTPFHHWANRWNPDAKSGSGKQFIEGVYWRPIKTLQSKGICFWPCIPSLIQAYECIWIT